MSVPLALGLLWFFALVLLAALRWRATAARDADRWLVEPEGDLLRVHPRGSLDRAGFEDWNDLAIFANHVGAKTVVLDLGNDMPAPLSPPPLAHARLSAHGVGLVLHASGAATAEGKLARAA